MPALLSADQRFLGLQDAFADPDRSRCVILPAPYERTSTFGAGSIHGPQSILRASREVELFDAALGFEPHRAADGIVTQVPLSLQALPGDEMVATVQDAVGYWRDRNKFIVTLGGEHTAILGAVKSHVESDSSVTVLQLDAHSDLRETYEGSPLNHACVMARVREFHTNIVSVGIRSQCVEERQAAEELGVKTFYAHDILRDARAFDETVDSILDAVGQRVYMTFDCDCLDPSIMPATGTPEPGGLSWHQVTTLLQRLCSEKELIGFDISELAPIAGVHHPEFTIAKLIYRVIGWKFAATK